MHKRIVESHRRERIERERAKKIVGLLADGLAAYLRKKGKGRPTPKRPRSKRRNER